MTQAKSFGELNFSNAQIGDARRTKRLVTLADQMHARPGGTLPQKFRSPADLQAFYRLMARDEVTHGAMIAPHREATLKRIAETADPILVLHDTTELDFTNHESLEDLGQIGCGTRKGYITHNSLAVHSVTREPMGLLNQILHRRETVSKSETRAERRKRSTRESRLWLQGPLPLPADRQLVDVCDRGADTFEFLQFEVASGRRFVIRSSHNRRIFVGHEGTSAADAGNLHEHIRSLAPAGTWQLEVTSKNELRRGRGKQKKKRVQRIRRTANMAVSFAQIQIRQSKCKGGSKTKPLTLWAVRVWEIDPPAGQERLEWILLTNERVASFTAAYRVVGWYECRWIVEEFHKAMKTGCRVESPQFTSEDRLQPCIALLSIVAITLLQLRDASRRWDAKERAATEVVSPTYVEVLSHWRHKKVKLDWSVHDFFYALARLGGHLNRKNDSQPGWQVLWEGWKELLPMANGYDIAKSKYYKKCG